MHNLKGADVTMLLAPVPVEESDKKVEEKTENRRRGSRIHGIK